MLKRWLINSLIKLLRHLDNPHFERCSIGTKLEADFTHYIPNDDKWHYCAMSIDYWLKINGDKIIKMDTYVDDVMVKRKVSHNE